MAVNIRVYTIIHLSKLNQRKTTQITLTDGRKIQRNESTKGSYAGEKSIPPLVERGPTMAREKSYPFPYASFFHFIPAVRIVGRDNLRHGNGRDKSCMQTL